MICHQDKDGFETCPSPGLLVKGAKITGGVKLAPGLSMRGVVLSLSPSPQRVRWYGAELITGTPGCYVLIKFYVLMVGEGDTSYCDLKYKI
jgi:hypothetical protein